MNLEINKFYKIIDEFDNFIIGKVIEKTDRTFLPNKYQFQLFNNYKELKNLRDLGFTLKEPFDKQFFIKPHFFSFIDRNLIKAAESMNGFDENIPNADCHKLFSHLIDLHKELIQNNNNNILSFELMIKQNQDTLKSNPKPSFVPNKYNMNIANIVSSKNNISLININ